MAVWSWGGESDRLIGGIFLEETQPTPVESAVKFEYNQELEESSKNCE